MTEDNKKITKIETAIIVKSLNSLMGIVSGLVSDGELNDREILFLKTWCDENRHIAGEYPANIIYRRVHEVLIDGVITDEEREHLLTELKIISGTDFANTGSALPEQIESIFDNDPTVIYEGNEFVFTGKFLYGTRNACQDAVTRRGARVKDYITQETNYLVIGTRSSPEWITENFGRKIQKAAEMASSGEYEISIMREVDWTMSLK
jgi:NAD-dependent DNA ligase